MFAVSILTIDKKKLYSKKVYSYLMSLADTVIEFESFTIDNVDPSVSTAYSSYDGFLHVTKTPTINCLFSTPFKINQIGGRRSFVFKGSLGRSVRLFL